LLLVGRSWHVGLSGPLIFFNCGQINPSESRTKIGQFRGEDKSRTTRQTANLLNCCAFLFRIYHVKLNLCFDREVCELVSAKMQQSKDEQEAETIYTAAGRLF